MLSQKNVPTRNFFLEKQKNFAKKTVNRTECNKMQVDEIDQFSKDFEELPILIDLNSSTESTSTSSSNTSSSYSDTTQPYQFYFGEIR